MTVVELHNILCSIVQQNNKLMEAKILYTTAGRYVEPTSILMDNDSRYILLIPGTSRITLIKDTCIGGSN